VADADVLDLFQEDELPELLFFGHQGPSIKVTNGDKLPSLPGPRKPAWRGRKIRSVRLLPVCLLLATPLTASDSGQGRSCGTSPDGSDHLLAQHRYWMQTQAGATTTGGDRDADVDHVAVLEDRGDLVARRNAFDLERSSLRFVPNAAGGYDPVPLAGALEPAGAPVSLGDDEAAALDLPFAFPFFGRRQDRVFLHADGSLTFDAPDAGPGERSMARFLSGPPRVAGFYRALDLSRGGTLTSRLGADRAVFQWSGVPGGGQINRNTFQVALLPTGEVEVVYGEMQSREALVGVAPGGSFDLTAADLSRGQPRAVRGALVERFSETDRLDLVSTVRRFLSSHPDLFDQVIVYTTRPLNPVPGSLAFEINVRNDVRGIGQDVVDHGPEWGSPARLSSVVFMDSIDAYLDHDGFEILGHEVGHRWLTRLRFRDPAGTGNGLLGRGLVHWSFFLDSDASVMEGNEIEDRGGGRFETVDFARGYSALDQYVMGFRAPEEVPPFFFVENADDFRPNRGYRASTAPEAGVSFTGVRRDVRIEDVIGELGPRVPDHTRAPRVMRQAFVLVGDAVAPVSETRRRAVARIRARFEEDYRRATGGRAAVDSTLP
jgi:hypothetical protein